MLGSNVWVVMVGAMTLRQAISMCLTAAMHWARCADIRHHSAMGRMIAVAPEQWQHTSSCRLQAARQRK